ncbi:MAG TPA: AI-2E family transporter [Bacillota bacterium]
MTRELKLIFILVSIGIGLIFGLKFLFPFIAPFLLGAFFACLMEPLVRKITILFGVSRRLAVGLVLSAWILFILSLAVIMVLALVQEAQRLIPGIPLFVNKLTVVTEEALRFLEHLPQLAQILKSFSLDPAALERILRALLGWILGFLPQFPGIFFAISLGGITAYLFSRDKERISRIFYQNLPRVWRPATVQIKDEVITTLGRFIRAEFGLVLMTTLLTTIIFFVLGIPGCFVYGMLAGVLDFFPVVGPGILYFPLALIQLLFGDYIRAFALIGGYFLLILVRQIAEVKLVGANLNFYPLLTIVVFYVGLKIFGFEGIIFGPVLIVTLRAIYHGLTEASRPLGARQQATGNREQA